MFGESYFATRKKLAGVVDDVRNLAGRSGVELNGFADDSKLLRGLKSPYLFVVCGEVNAGKSTFINGLFGEELCEVNVLPQTDRVLWYRYGEPARDEEITPVLEERYRAIDFLQDFNVVDTPGTNSVIRGHQAITERFLPVADLVLFVFPAGNPWGAATWDFIARFPDELRGKVAFVLQQKDLREEREIEIIIEHVRELAQQKLGAAPEVFAVSGKLAVEAKKRAPFESRRWEESGYPHLERFVSRIVTESPGRRKVLCEIREAATHGLREIENALEAQAELVRTQGSLLRELEGEIDRQCDRYGGNFEDKIASLGEVFSEEGRNALHLLRERIGIGLSLFSLFKQDESPAEIEKALSNAVQAAIEDLADAEAADLTRLCREHWEHVAPRIRRELGIEPPAITAGEVDREEAVRRFVRRLGRAARQSVAKLKLRGRLEMQLDLRRNVLQRFVAAALLLLSAGGALGAMRFDVEAWGAIGLAVLVALTGYAQARRSGRRLLRRFAERIEESREPFTEMLSGEYREGVRAFFSQYAKLFDLVEESIEEARAGLAPRQREWRNIYIEMKALEEEI